MSTEELYKCIKTCIDETAKETLDLYRESGQIKS